MSETAAEAGYVACSECGHAMEAHALKGCYGADGCACPTTTTRAEVVQLRVASGLSGYYRRRDF